MGQTGNLKFALAKVASSLSTKVLKTAFKRPAANFPGKIGLVINPRFIADLRPRVQKAVIAVVGTNGKTTVTNLLADALESADQTVVCNRTGANLDSGVATALLQTGTADWGVFECDELWLSKMAPHLQPDCIVLLNLFRDQLDRSGEIEHVQESIMSALEACPRSTLIYNADDPLCQAIANAVANRRIAFGIDEDMMQPHNAVIGGSVCRQCGAMLDYAWRQYGQLGNYHCAACGFARPDLDHAAIGVAIGARGSSFTVKPEGVRMATTMPGAYTVYNLLAAYAATNWCGIEFSHINAAVSNYTAHNGRLQTFDIDGRHILLNLAKNPTGMNQSLNIALDEPGSKAVAFFINDNEADGRDVSWLWDADFQDASKAADLVAFAGGARRCDMQVRLKYAGINAQLIDDIDDLMARLHVTSPATKLFVIANYTALPPVKKSLERLQRESASAQDGKAIRFPGNAATSRSAKMQIRIDEALPDKAKSPERHVAASKKLVIAHIYPELLNLYGDGGNVVILSERARRRGVDVEIERITRGDMPDFSRIDIVFIGGGPDREQHFAAQGLMELTDNLHGYVEDYGVLLAICGGFQIIGREWILGDETVPGLGLVDCVTRRAPGGSHNRLVGNVVLESPLAHMPVVGYENHAGRTFLGESCVPFGTVIDKRGHGNNDTNRVDGVLYKHVVGTYLHGPLLAKNPEVADWLLERALSRRAAKENRSAPTLPPLDDSEERAANEFMRT